MTPIKYNKGDILFKQGDEGDCMYDIKWGQVGVYDSYGTENEILLATLSTDDFLGEMGMIEGRPRSATAVALEEVHAYRINKEDFTSYFSEKPAKILTILQYASNRMRELTKSYLDVCGTLKEYVALREDGKEIPKDLMKKMKAISKE